MSRQTSFFDQRDTLSDARERVRARLDDGVECPCCGLFAKRYRRKLHAGMAVALIAIYRTAAAGQFLDGWMHVTKELLRRGVNPYASEYSKLEFWGFVEPKPGQKKGSNEAGYWRITEAGRLFVEGRAVAPRVVLVYANRVVEYLGTTTVREALGDKFSYEELMGSVPTPPDRGATEAGGEVSRRPE